MVCFMPKPCGGLQTLGLPPTPAYELQQRPGGCTSFSRLQPYALFQRCGAPEFAMWAALIFLPGTRMAVVEAASTVVRQTSSRHLPIARFAGRTRNASGL